MNDIKIQKKYYLKTTLGSIIGLIFSTAVWGFFMIIPSADEGVYAGAISLAIWIGIALFIFVIGYAGWFLWLMFFKYRFDEDFICANQGIISRSERHLPYSVIQSVVIRQDILDRLFGLATIIVENASFGGIGMPANNNRSASMAYGSASMGSMGMHANKFVLSGITLDDAEKLREWLLNKTIKVVSKMSHQEL